jgi:hypothetical protein
VVVVEWIGAHLLGPLINLYRAIMSRPRPDVRILELKSVGGTSDFVDFNIHVANYGTQQCRCVLTARVGEEAVECGPPALDLIPNVAPQLVRVIVPRPRLGELVPQFNHETTLYDRTLHVEASVGKHKATSDWHETIYTPETNRERYDIQQRVWRRGGEETPDDLRADAIDDHFRRIDED